MDMDGADKLWEWALEMNSLPSHSPSQDDGEEEALRFLDEIQGLLDTYGLVMVGAMYMDDGLVIKWVDEEEVDE
jgi:hypothetical protein